MQRLRQTREGEFRKMEEIERRIREEQERRLREEQEAARRKKEAEEAARKKREEEERARAAAAAEAKERERVAENEKSEAAAMRGEDGPWDGTGKNWYRAVVKRITAGREALGKVDESALARCFNRWFNRISLDKNNINGVVWRASLRGGSDS